LFAIADGIIFFIFFIGGEITNCLVASFRVIYSSKSILNSLRLVGTFLAKESGFEATTLVAFYPFLLQQVLPPLRRKRKEL
jgi:hypothetical protein